jgi:hypothetical protein
VVKSAKAMHSGRKAQVDEATNEGVNMLTRNAPLQDCFFEDDAGRTVTIELA